MPARGPQDRRENEGGVGGSAWQPGPGCRSRGGARCSRFPAVHHPRPDDGPAAGVAAGSRLPLGPRHALLLRPPARRGAGGGAAQPAARRGVQAAQHAPAEQDTQVAGRQPVGHRCVGGSARECCASGLDCLCATWLASYQRQLQCRAAVHSLQAVVAAGGFNTNRSSMATQTYPVQR